MKCAYADILELTDRTPEWWDEKGVPRFCAFHPDEVANIYASQVVLAEIWCQGCSAPYKVAFSWHRLQGTNFPLDHQINHKMLHYGDPPNYGCCAAGATMNSMMQGVLEYWEQDESGTWQRNKTFERSFI